MMLIIKGSFFFFIKGSLKGIWKLIGKSVGQHLAPDPQG